MKKYTVLALILFLNMQFITAQDYKFGKVSVEELQEKTHPIDAEADAAILHKKRRTHFDYDSEDGWYVITEVSKRIKIYTKEGSNWATKELSFYESGSGKEVVSGIKGYTYNLVDGKIEETKLKKDAIFKEDINENWKSTKFTLPNIQVGSVIEYKYKKRSPFLQIEDVEIQEQIPVNAIDVKIQVPKYFYYKKQLRGYYQINIDESKRNRSLNVSYRAKRSDGYALKSSESTKLEFFENIYIIKANNIIPIKEEPFVNNIDNYKTTLDFELATYEKFNGEIKNVSSTWEDVTKSIYESDSFGKELKTKGYYKDEIASLVEGVTNPAEKAALVYNFVKKRVKWNGRYGVLTQKGVRKAFKEQAGNVADINLMLTAMLRHVGINANPVLVSTRRHGIPLFPTREGYNYVISAIELKDKVVLLDATTTYASANILPFRTLNWEGRLIRKDGSSTSINLFPNTASSKTDSFSFILEENGNIEGRRRTMLTNHYALGFRQEYIGADLEDYLEKKENRIQNIEIENYDVKNAKDISKPIMESYAFTMESQAERIGDKIYFSPLFFLSEFENKFKADDRQYPVDFGYPSKYKAIISIKLPEGYAIESMPEKINMALPEGMGSYAFNISKSNSGINVVVSRDINTAIIPQLYYPDLKEYFKRIVDKETEKVVLTKI